MRNLAGAWLSLKCQRRPRWGSRKRVNSVWGSLRDRSGRIWKFEETRCICFRGTWSLQNGGTSLLIISQTVLENVGNGSLLVITATCMCRRSYIRTIVIHSTINMFYRQQNCQKRERKCCTAVGFLFRDASLIRSITPRYAQPYVLITLFLGTQVFPHCKFRIGVDPSVTWSPCVQTSHICRPILTAFITNLF